VNGVAPDSGASVVLVLHELPIHALKGIDTVMSQLRTLLFLILSLFLITSAVDAEDQVWLKGGDRFTGKIIKVDEGKLVFELLVGGKVNIPLEKISAVQTDRPLNITLADGSTIKEGRLHRGEKGSAVKKADQEFSPITDFMLLKSIKDPNEKPKERDIWSGKLNVSGLITGGNTREKAAHIDGEIVGRWEKSRLTLDGGWDYGERDKELTTRRSHASIKGDWFVIEKGYLYARDRIENDEFQDLRVRHSMGLGMGYQVLETEKAELQFDVGASYVIEREEIRTAPPPAPPLKAKDRETDGYATADASAKFHYKLTDGVTFSEELLGFKSLKDTDDIRLVSTTGVDVLLTSRLSLTFRVVWEYDNQPAPGTKRVDTRYLTGIAYSFW